MSAATPSGTGLAYGVERVCAAWKWTRASLADAEAHAREAVRRHPFRDATITERLVRAVATAEEQSRPGRQ